MVRGARGGDAPSLAHHPSGAKGLTASRGEPPRDDRPTKAERELDLKDHLWWPLS